MILNKYDEKTVEEIAACYRRILELVGEDPSREGLLKTPVRAAKAIMDITRGYREDPEGIVRSAIFEHSGSQVVTVKDIEFYSVCEHHILPFFGRISIGYVPDGHIVGLSKLARIVDVYAHRLQVQERLTGEIWYPYEQRGNSGVSGRPFVHEDARSGKARQHNGDDGLQRCLCRRCFVTPRVP